jgi:hypothetical protein
MAPAASPSAFAVPFDIEYGSSMPTSQTPGLPTMSGWGTQATVPARTAWCP